MFFYDDVQLPYTDSSHICPISIWILQLMQRYIDSQLVLSTSNSLYGSITLGYTSTYGSLKHTQSLPICMQARFGPPHSHDRAKKWIILHANGCWRCLRGFWWPPTIHGASCVSVV